MLPAYTRDRLAEAEHLAGTGADPEHVYAVLRRLPLADFAMLHHVVPAAYPQLRQVVPTMPSAEAQVKWVGDSGLTLLSRSANTIRLLENLTYRVTGSGPEGKRILDYGSGWGRLLRLANYFSPIDRVRGVDVMQSSVDQCAGSGILNEVELIAPRPASLPYGDEQFDLVFSFSVFTHIPVEVARPVLEAVRQRIASEGLFVITIRSLEFWNMRKGVWADEVVADLCEKHEKDGYAFLTFEAGEINADYGDTTMSFDFVNRLAAETGWKVARIDRDLSEPFQIAVALVPA